MEFGQGGSIIRMTLMLISWSEFWNEITPCSRLLLLMGFPLFFSLPYCVTAFKTAESNKPLHFIIYSACSCRYRSRDVLMCNLNAHLWRQATFKSTPHSTKAVFAVYCLQRIRNIFGKVFPFKITVGVGGDGSVGKSVCEDLRSFSCIHVKSQAWLCVHL